MQQQYTSEEEKEPAIYQVHPHRMMLYFAIASITSLFIGFSVAYLFTKGHWQWEQFRFPKVFLISTLALVGSSFTLNKALQLFQSEQSETVLKMLYYTIWLSMGFVVLQLAGWFSLNQMGIYLAGKPDGSYLYLLTGIHAAHVLAGVLLLYLAYRKLKKHLQDPVQELIYFTDPNQKLKLELIATYWHFVDILWVYLLFFFLFNHL